MLQRGVSEEGAEVERGVIFVVFFENWGKCGWSREGSDRRKGFFFLRESEGEKG